MMRLARPAAGTLSKRPTLLYHSIVTACLSTKIPIPRKSEYWLGPSLRRALHAPERGYQRPATRPRRGAVQNELLLLY